ncbi:MAG: T9SS type A sorting domain-containing protein, partial [Phycisphaerales bacterium]
GTGNGISIYETNGISSYHISDCVISDNSGVGVRLYNSIGKIISCTISGNNNGVTAYRVSNVTIEKDPNSVPYERNSYIGNNLWQEIIFLNESNLFLNGNRNMIVDNSYILGTYDQYLIHCPNLSDSPQFSNNFWGYRDQNNIAIIPPENRFYPQCLTPEPYETGYYLDPVWEPGIPREVTQNNDEIVFNSAIDAALDDNPSLAVYLFKHLISDFPASKFTSASAKHLFALEDDKQALKDYYQTEPNLHYNGEIDKIIDYLTTHCNFKLGNYQEAIDWFEDVISNPDSEIDSLMAVIDLGYVYMLMEGDDKASVICRYPQLKPKTMSEYETNRESILANLFGTAQNQAGYTNSVYNQQAVMPVLRSNFPNPFNPSTTISFLLPKDATCSLDVYNIRGQKVRSLINEPRFAGNHSVVWNGLDDSGKPVSSGLYFYRLTTPNSSQTNKMLLLK